MKRTDVWRASRSGAVVVVGLLATGAVGCSGATAPSDGTRAAQSAPAAYPPDVLGFESAGAWTLNRGTATSSTLRTQGTAALSLAAPAQEVDLVSPPIAATYCVRDGSGACTGVVNPSLPGIADPASSFSIDVLVPTQLANPNNAGSLELLVSAPAEGIARGTFVGQVSFQGSRLGLYQTVKFPLPATVRQALAAGTFTDLSFDVRLHAPGGQTAGTYLFDNLRVHAPSTPPAGYGQQVDLTALLTYAPPSSTVGSASFPLGALQVPQSLHAKLGAAGAGTATLAITNGGQPLATCSYAGAGADYVFASCTGGFHAGDLVPADGVALTLLGGDASAGTTKVRAQLAVNPAGDTLGAGVLPPMPTYWGRGGADTSAILDAYTAALTATQPGEHVWVKTPTPDYARRTSDFSPVDTSNGPPPPNDPDFHAAGHANPGGDFDAYWALDGNLSAASQDCGPGSTTCRNTAHFEADASAHAVLFGNDSTVAEVKVTADTDSGAVQLNGFQSPSDQGCFYMYLFGVQTPDSGCSDPSLGIDATLGISPSNPETVNLPPITFWVFSITVGVFFDAGVTVQGKVVPTAISLGVKPYADFGAHLEGDIGVPGIIEGGLDVKVDLLHFDMPLDAEATITISTDPYSSLGCAAGVRFDASGNITLNSGGGEVDLEATFGPCPFCLSASQKLFGWPPLFSTNANIFSVADTLLSFPLPPDLCASAKLNVSASAPATVVATAATVLSGSASRPASLPDPNGFPTLITDPSDFTWTSDNPGDFIVPGAQQNPVGAVTGNAPVVVFGSPGTRTLTLTVTDKFGETGSAQVVVDVLPPPAQLTAYTTLPAACDSTVASCPGPGLDLDSTELKLINLVGTSAGGSGNVSLTWKIVAPNGALFLIPGVAPGVTTQFDIDPTENPGPGVVSAPDSFLASGNLAGDYQVILYAQDLTLNQTVSATVIVDAYHIK